MAAELSLELIESCLGFGDIECDSLLSEAQTETFLKEKQAIWKKSEQQFLKASSEKKKVIEGFIEEFESKEAGKRKLEVLKEGIITKEEEYNKAGTHFNEAQKAYDEQNTNVNNIETELIATGTLLANVDSASKPPKDIAILHALGHQLQSLGDCAWRASPRTGVDAQCRATKENLKTKEQQQRQALEEAKKNLANKNLDKTTKADIKNHLQIELENNKLMENDLESRLNKWMEEENDLGKLQNNCDMLHKQITYMELMLKQLQTGEVQEDFKSHDRVDFFEEAKITDLIKEFNIEVDCKVEL